MVEIFAIYTDTIIDLKKSQSARTNIKKLKLISDYFIKNILLSFESFYGRFPLASPLTKVATRHWKTVEKFSFLSTLDRIILPAKA